MTDLSKAKPGWKVKFRAGGEETIRDIEYCTYETSVWFESSAGLYRYKADGRSSYGTIIDIIEITEPEFDWKDVKPGMAFVFEDKENTNPYWIYFYSGRCVLTGTMLFSSKPKNPLDDRKEVAQEFDGGFFRNSIRAPQYDLEPLNA